MAWRPAKYIISGVWDNSKSGRITGWMKFLGMDEEVAFELTGDFDGSHKGSVINFFGGGQNSKAARDYMRDFFPKQTGRLEELSFENDFVYIEWNSDKNGRVVLELDSHQVKIIKNP